MQSFGRRRLPVTVTINGYTYRTTMTMMRGVAMVPVSSAVRAAAGVAAGDIVTVDIAPDSAPREVDVPDDLTAALSGHDDARAFFEQLSYSRQLAYTTWITQAKQATTRARRVERTIELLAAHRPQR